MFSASSFERTVLYEKRPFICHIPTLCYWITPDYINSTRHPITVVSKTAFLNPLVGNNQHFFKKWNQMVSEYITLSNLCFRCMCVEIGCVFVCVCMCMLACASDPDNSVFLLCCTLKSWKNISLSDEVWYYFQMRKLKL